MTDETRKPNPKAPNPNTDDHFDQSGPQPDPNDEAAKLPPTERKAKPRAAPPNGGRRAHRCPRAARASTATVTDNLKRDAKNPRTKGTVLSADPSHMDRPFTSKCAQRPCSALPPWVKGDSPTQLWLVQVTHILGAERDGVDVLIPLRL